MNLPVATTNNKQMLSSYVHDVYELEEKIYATEKLVADLENKRADFIDKQKSMIPTRPICQRKVPTKPYKEKRDIKKYISESQRIKKIENEYSNKLKKECKFRPVRFFVVYGVFLQVFLVAYIPLWFYFSNMLLCQ